MSFYFYILLGTILVPLVLSFVPRFEIYSSGKAYFLSIFLVSVPFLFWDHEFTILQIWGYNDEHIRGIKILNLPLEQILFYLIIPFFYLFVYVNVRRIFDTKNFDFYAKIFGFSTALSAIILAMIHMPQWYTLWATALTSLLVIGVCFQLKAKWFGHFSVAFTICLLPMLLISGLLTGMFTQSPVIWYDDERITGFLLGTIPMENFYFNLGLFLALVFVYETLNTKKASSKTEDAL